MHPNISILCRANNEYPGFKTLFQEFLDKCKVVNNNQQLPLLSLSPADDGLSARLKLLDGTFGISFRFLMYRGVPLGVLQASLIGEMENRLPLWHVFFDNLGNVKDTPDSTSTSMHNIRNSNFVEVLLGELTVRYFSHLERELSPPQPVAPADAG